jgi:mannose-6-phosphate isomerase
MFLFEAAALDPLQVLGKAHMDLHGTNMGVLVKYLDAQEPYILQAHPTREWAKKMWSSDFGKEESWYVIGVRDDVPQPYILLGFKEGVTRKDWEALYYQDDLAGLEKLCHTIPVSVGDAFFVGGGVPHALGKGCFVIEVQEPSDITVVPIRQQELLKRFAKRTADKADKAEARPPRPVEDDAVYDEKTLGAFVYEGYTAEENLKRRRIAPKIIRQGDWGKEYFIIGPEQTSYFSFTRLDAAGTADIRHTGFPQIGIVLEGSGTILFEEGAMPVKGGDEIFFPYRVPGARLQGELSLVLCHPEGANA